MTIHSAKGLEFPYVFLIGMEEGVVSYTHLELKKHVACCPQKTDFHETMEIKGRSLLTGLPVRVNVSTDDLYEPAYLLQHVFYVFERVNFSNFKSIYASSLY